MNTTIQPFVLNEEAKEKAKFLLSLFVLMLVMATFAHAGGDQTFSGWVDTMEEWLEGSLGKGVSISFILVGIIMGVTRQSLMAFATGVGAALGLNYAPAVIGGMFSATIL